MRESVQAYASRDGTADLVARFSTQAASEGYRSIKLHEITMPEIRAGRGAIDRGISFTVDVNCAWSEQYAAEVLPELADLETLWLEEPVFPPEDWVDPRRLGGGAHGVAIAAGENACTAMEFSRLIPSVTYSQPSVTKVGGISEFLRIAEIAKAHGRTLTPQLALLRTRLLRHASARRGTRWFRHARTPLCLAAGLARFANATAGWW